MKMKKIETVVDKIKTSQNTTSIFIKVIPGKVFSL
jgi:hypothetical protein